MSAKAHAHLLDTAAELSPALTEAIERCGPLRLQRRLKDAPFDVVLCRAVAGQQLSVKAAETIWGRVLASACDQPLVDYLPSAAPEALRACGLSGAKAKAMCAISEAARRGDIDPEGLAPLSHTERAKRLTAIWGVGQWTADMMSIFYFGDPDVWPDGDVTARKTLTKLTSPRRKTPRTAARFAPYRSYLALHMWRYVDGAPV